MRAIRFIILSLILSGFSLHLFSASISESEALKKAQQFYAQKSASSLRSALDFQLIFTCKDTTSLLRSTDATPYYYIFNIGNQQGFIIVSGDDATKTILGYSDQGSFSAGNWPENIQYWLDFYKSEIKYAVGAEIKTTLLDSANTAETINLRASGSVEPLLGLIKWNQDKPFNLLCPYYGTDNKLTVTGCVATAMAQIMKYHEWPVTGLGSKSYNNATYEALSANFGQTSYDWNNMLDDYGSTSTAVQDTAVARLMYHFGVAVEMKYNLAANGGSGANSNDAGRALMDYFEYDTDIQMYTRKFYTASEWNSMIKTELNAARPVYYAGWTESSGHAFVCDGYDSNDLFHINWGWGGSSNGYFELSALKSASPGIGGATGGYSQDQEIITGIQKPDDSSNISYQFGMHSNGLTSTKATLSQISSEKTDFTFGFLNFGINSFSGEINIGLYQNGIFKKLLGTSSSVSLPPNYGYSSRTFNNCSFSNLSSGNYQVYCIFQNNGSSSWSVIKGTNELNNCLNVVINGNSATIQKPTATPVLALTQALQLREKVYHNKTANFSATLKNTGTELYSNLGIYLYSTENGSISQYVNYGVVCIPSGETKTFSFSGKITCAPGMYYAVAVYDSTNSYSSNNFKQIIGQAGYSPVIITVLSETAAPDLGLINQLSLCDNLPVYRNEPFSLTVDVRNAGGYFDSRVIAFIYPGAGGTSLGYFGPKAVFIDTDDTLKVSLSGEIDLSPGDYFFYLYYYNSAWTQFSPNNYSRLPFTLAEQTTGITTSGKTGWCIFPNPVKDVLNVQTTETIRKMLVFDVSGRILLSAHDTNTLSVSNLKAGVFLLKVETENGSRTLRFIIE